MKIRTMFLYIIIAALILTLTSCSRYSGYGTGGGCGVWFPKKFENGGRFRSGNGPSPRFGRH